MIIERKLFSKIKPYIESKEAIIVTGMRRTGKTSLMQYIFNLISSQNKLFLDLENPVNQRYFEETNYEKVKTSLEILGLRFSEKAFLFLDEIQFVKNLPSVLKYLIDHYNLKCFLTGSASFYLKNIFAESMAGRKYIFELFGLDFEEFLRFKNSDISVPSQNSEITRPVFETISNLYDEYLYFGGFPDVALKQNVEEKKKSLEDIFSSYFQLEVLRLGDYRKNNVIRDLILLLMQRIGSGVDISKLSSELGVSRITMNEYIAFLEGTYFIKLIKPFSRKKDVEIRKMPKVYLCDSGMANHFAKISGGSLFENNILQNLRAKGDVNYYQKKSGAEIDFILNGEIGIEAKINPVQSDLAKLEKVGKEIGLKGVKICSKTYCLDKIPPEKVIFGFNICAP